MRGTVDSSCSLVSVQKEVQSHQNVWLDGEGGGSISCLEVAELIEGRAIALSARERGIDCTD